MLGRKRYRDICSESGRAADGNAILLPKQKTDTVVHIQQRNTGASPAVNIIIGCSAQLFLKLVKCFRLHSNSVVGDPHDQPFFRQCQPNRDYTDPYLSFQSMNNCILHKRLHRQLWDLTILDPRLRIVDLQAKPISEPKLLDRKICLNILQFFGYANKIFNLADGIPEKLCQVFCHIRHDIESTRNRLAADSLQRIIEEMRIDLVLQSKILPAVC